MSVFACSQCGAQHKRWVGRCTECGAWSTVSEDKVDVQKVFATGLGSVEIVSLGNTSVEQVGRVSSTIIELNNVLGGGFVPGSVILLGGEPGIGKSTLLLNLSHALTKAGHNTVYVSGEESISQIFMRAQRMGLANDSKIHVVSTGLINAVINKIDKENTKFLVVDSIQTIYVEDIDSSAGTIGQIKAAASALITLAKQYNITLILVAHITKDGTIAGPKLLEHLVDVVVHFEGDNINHFRLLRTTKNRFGPTNEIGIFVMEGSGLVEVSNPSSFFIESNAKSEVIFVAMEGMRPILAMVEALAVNSYTPMPRRSVVGWDNNRLGMILAVMQSYCGVTTYDKDIYLSMAGGFKTLEPANDLAVIIAIISAIKKQKLNGNIIAFGEISLSGNVRRVAFMQNRLKEALRLGYTHFIVPKCKEIDEFDFTPFSSPAKHLQVVQISTLKEVISIF